jgi:hypothetical protein
MNLASKSPVMSFFITSRLSSMKQHNFCLTGFEVGLTLSVCSISSLGTSDISQGFQTKISRLS